MKRFKHLGILILFSLTLSVFSCDFWGNSGKTLQKPDIFISEFYSGSSINDCILEIGTLSEEEIDLTQLKINIYSTNSLVHSLSLDDIRITKSSLLLVENLESTFTDTTSTIVKLDGNYLYGLYYTEIVDKDNNVIDRLGNKGFNLSYCERQSFVKLKEHYMDRDSFDKMNFVHVREGITKYLGNLDCPVTEEELLQGPKLDTEEYGNLPFQRNEGSLGGYTRVTLRYLGDGDTTYFNWPEDSSLSSSTSVRYLLIDTPEIDHGDGGGEKYGDTAKNFNNERIRNATLIYVQSCRGGALHESYGRYLGFVWYTTKSNPTIDDLTLFNHEIVKAGLAKLSLYNKYEEMYYNDILYYDYLDYANMHAKKNKLYIHED